MGISLLLESFYCFRTILNPYCKKKSNAQIWRVILVQHFKGSIQNLQTVLNGSGALQQTNSSLVYSLTSIYLLHMFCTSDGHTWSGQAGEVAADNQDRYASFAREKQRALLGPLSNSPFHMAGFCHRRQHPIF